MDCRSARELLDVARTGDRDAYRPELVRAWDHVDGCVSCRAVVDAARALDRRLEGAMRRVDVPVGLREQLARALGLTLTDLDSAASRIADDRLTQKTRDGERWRAASNAGTIDPVGSSASTVVVKAADTDSPGSHAPERSVSENRVLRGERSSGRAWRWVAGVAVAAMLMVGAGVWWSQPNVPPLQARGLERLLAEGKFSEGSALRYQPRLPETMDTRWLPAGAPQTVAIGERAIAVYEFEIGGRRGRQVTARLAIVPRPWLSGENLASGYLLGPVGYVGRSCTTAWAEGEFAYVCSVMGDDQDLRRLLLPHRAT